MTSSRVVLWGQVAYKIHILTCRRCTNTTQCKVLTQCKRFPNEPFDQATNMRLHDCLKNLHLYFHEVCS